MLVRQDHRGRCPCGAQHAACGPPSDTVPVDERIEEVTAVGGPLKKYRIVTSSGAQSVVKYNAADAERNGLTDADLVGEGTTAAPSPDEEAAAEPKGKARTGARNKARTSARSKGGGADGGGA